jgi:signal peptidase I
MTSEADSLRRDRSGRAEKPKRGGWLFLRDIVLIFVAALIISFLIKTFLVRSFYIPSESMEDTLHVNDRIIVNLLTPKYFPLAHGDIVVFKDPGGWLDPKPPAAPVNPVLGAVDGLMAFVGLSAPDSNDHLIKRIIGLPGDHVTCCNDFGQLSVNGIPLAEPYIKLPDGVTKVTRDNFDIVVPANSLWVMGDNRYASADSAFHHSNDPGHEYVPYTDIVGRAVFISWPLSRWNWLDDYQVVYRDVPSPTVGPVPTPTPTPKK